MKKLKGFTLVELLITISITTLVIIVAIMVFFAVLRSEKLIVKLDEFHDFVTKLDINLMNNYNEYFFKYPPQVQNNNIVIYHFDYNVDPSAISSYALTMPSNYSLTIIPTYTNYIDPPATKVEVFIHANEISTGATLIYVKRREK